MTAIPEPPSTTSVMWEEGRGQREGFQLSLHSSRLETLGVWGQLPLIMSLGMI